MKTVKKALLLVLCAVLMVGASVFGTLAYLTDQEAVTNTFSVGSVGLSLDEAKVTPDGVPVTGADRVHDNEYHLLPGMSYTKDPVIHVDLNSEDSYIFVKVENAIADYEAATENTTNGYKSIADQIDNNDWTPLDGVENVYYKTYTKGQNDKDLEVFANFKIDGMANTVLGWDAITPETTKVNVTGYAVQKAGFGTAKQAWDATFASETGGDSGSGDSDADYPAEPGYVYTVYFNTNGNTYGHLLGQFTCPEHNDGEVRNFETMESTVIDGVLKCCFNWNPATGCTAECPHIFHIENVGSGIVISHKNLKKGVNVFTAP